LLLRLRLSRRNRETLWGSGLLWLCLLLWLLLLLLALEFLQELFWSLYCRLTVWLLLLLLIRLVGLVGLILCPGILLGKFFVHVLGFLPGGTTPGGMPWGWDAIAGFPPLGCEGDAGAVTSPALPVTIT